MNIANIFDNSDPSHDELEPGTYHTLIGIINAPVTFVPICAQSKVVLKVPLKTGSYISPSQCIIDIEANSKETEPKFCSDWTRLQLAVFKNCKFRGKRTNFGLEFFLFTVSSAVPNARFIWLSAPRRDFWMDPIPKPDHPSESAWRPVPNSGPISNAHGFLERSRGSVIGNFWSKNKTNIHTDTSFNGMKFVDFALVVQKLRRDIIFPPEVLLVDGIYNHPLFNPPPLMHQ